MNEKGSQLLKENTFRGFVKYILCLCLMSLNAQGSDQKAADQKERPNVLFLAVDDHG